MIKKFVLVATFAALLAIILLTFHPLPVNAQEDTETPTDTPTNTLTPTSTLTPTITPIYEYVRQITAGDIVLINVAVIVGSIFLALAIVIIALLIFRKPGR